MGIFNVDYIALVTNLLPPDKRNPKRISFLTAFTKRISVDSSNYFDQYKSGSSDPTYVTGTYARRATVIYNGAVYQSLNDDNIALPSDTTQWRQIAPSFIGVDTRIQFRASKIVFEYALNLRFTTTFRQPPSISDIYITTNYMDRSGFIIGYNESGASSVGYSGSADAIGYANNNYTPYFQLTINVPLAAYNAVGVGVIKGFASLYVAAGIVFNVVAY